MSKKLFCSRCGAPIDSETDVHYESEIGNVCCMECADDALEYSEDVQAFVCKEQYKDLFLDDDIADVDLFNVVGPTEDI